MQQRIHTFVREFGARAIAVLTMLAVLALAPGALAQQGPTIQVDCNVGQSVQEALRVVPAGSTIQLSGTCNEAITITTDDVTLDGQGSAVIDGEGLEADAVTVDAARNVVITGLTVRNGDRGIFVFNDAVLAIRDSVVEGSDSHAIEVIHAKVDVTNHVSRNNGRAGLIVNRNSHLTLTDGTLEGNLTGLVVYSNASARLRGDNVMTGNDIQGFTIGLGAVVFAIGANVESTGNGADGLLVQHGGRLELIGGSVQVAENGGNGILLEHEATAIFGIPGFGAEGSVTSENNEGHGVSVTGGSRSIISTAMPVTSLNNAGDGLHVDGGSSVDATASTFQDNEGTDVAFAFASLGTLTENTIGTIACDDTVHVRGDSTCPE